MAERVVFDEVVRVIRETFGDDAVEVSRTTTADDIADWDSVSNVELLVALEQAFAVKFYTGEIAALHNIGELVDVISARLDGRGGSTAR